MEIRIEELSKKDVSFDRDILVDATCHTPDHGLAVAPPATAVPVGRKPIVPTKKNDGNESSYQAVSTEEWALLAASGMQR